MNGILEVLAITLILSLLIALVYKFLQKNEKIKDLKQKQLEIKKRIEKAKKDCDKEAADKAMMELLKINQELLKINMKPMFLTTIIFLAVLAWIGNTYANLIIPLPFTIPFFGSQLNWFWWYVVIIIPCIQIFKKFFGVE
jgi:uncharacterized membrane protein (DUF106 family)